MSDDPPRPELWQLSVGYARAVDRRDTDAFLAVFSGDAVLSVHNPAGGGPGAVYRGHEDLARIPPRMSRYKATFHFLGQADYRSEGDTAAGEIYCMAHHRTGGADDPSDHVMLIRYQDRYGREGGVWRISERRVLVDWTETRPVDAPGR